MDEVLACLNGAVVAGSVTVAGHVDGCLEFGGMKKSCCCYCAATLSFAELSYSSCVEQQLGDVSMMPESRTDQIVRTHKASAILTGWKFGHGDELLERGT